MNIDNKCKGKDFQKTTNLNQFGCDHIVKRF